MKTLIVILALICSAHADPRIVVSIPAQRMAVVDGRHVSYYPVSTSAHGLGNAVGSRCTPLGTFQVIEKIGDHLPLGEVFNHRVATGRISNGSRPGIFTRILRLAGRDPGNANTEDRGIYIHGALDRCIGSPHSIGCVGMRSADVIRLFDQIQTGTPVAILNAPLRTCLQWTPKISEVPINWGRLAVIKKPVILLATRRDRAHHRV